MKNFVHSKYYIIILLFISCYQGTLFSQNHQAEVSSFETMSNTDMVNLSTGDFVYTMPVMHIPGSYGGYTVNLSYHGDIYASQKSSWVGLGWNLNPGSILRSVNGYADDFSGALISNSLSNAGSNGYSRSWFLYNQSYNNNEGLSHSLDVIILSTTWDSQGVEDFGIIGIHRDFRANSTYVDAKELASGILEVALAIVSFGGSEAAIGAAEALGTVKEVYGYAQTAVSLYQTYESMRSFFDYSSNSALWHEYKRVSLFNGGIVNTEYDYHLNSNIKNTVYGSLYLQKFKSQATDYDCSGLKSGVLESLTRFVMYRMPNGIGIKTELQPGDTGVTQSIHDCYMYVDGGGDGYIWSKNPTKITYDNFIVQGGSVSGSIKPYRTEIGSLATDKIAAKNVRTKAINNFDNERVGFRYEGSLNYYDYHENKDASRTAGIDWVYNPITGSVEYELNDEHLYCDPYPEDRTGFRNKNLYGGNDVRWYTNIEIMDQNGIAKLEGFIDYVPKNYADASAFRTYCADLKGNGILDSNGIGGFMITSTEGTVYHYALPVYNIAEYTVTISGTTDASTTSEIRNNNKYAINWLLTAITGSDYYDANNSGKPDKGDWGFWITYDYSRYTDSFITRTPASGYMYDEGLNSKTYTQTTSEIYFLDYISTNTHVATFVKSAKAGRDEQLKLDEIKLYSLDDFNSGLVAGYPYNSVPNELKKLKFTYNYELAKDAFGNGLLSLKSINTLFEGNNYIYPPYQFEYATNPEYSVSNWDGWGKYANGANSDAQLNRNPQSTSNGDEWSLTKIITPTGASINVSYERDSYSSVMGSAVGGYSVYPQYSKSDGNIMYGLSRNLDGSTKIIFHNGIDLSDAIVGGKIKVKDMKVNCIFGFGTWEYTFFGEYNIIEKSSNSITFSYSSLPTNLPSSGLNITGYDIADFKGISWSNNTLSEHLGGGNRVSQVEITDGINSSKTKYIYTTNGEEDGNSSGFCMNEPSYCRSNLDQYDSKEYKFGIPSGGVSYSKLTVLSDYKSSTNYQLRTEYNYEAPDLNTFKFEMKSDSYDGPVVPNTSSYYLKLSNYFIHDYTSKLGRINSVNQFNLSGDVIRSIEYNYDNDCLNGKITHGTILSEETTTSPKCERLFRTTIIEYPNILKSIVYNTPNSQSSVSYSDIDVESNSFLTETNRNQSCGVEIVVKKLPAYKVYPSMGHRSSADNNTMKNMLSQNAAILTYKNGVPLNARIQTWKGDWSNNYGKYGYLSWNATTGRYDYNGTDNGETIWRKHKTYIWNGDLDAEGYYGSDFANFNSPDNIKQNWGSIVSEPTTSKWLKTSEVIRYDHYSSPIEAMDINGDFAATKKDPDQLHTVATAANARHTQFAHCGFEYGPYIDYHGEAGTYINYSVNVLDSTQHEVHTGEYCMVVGSTKTGVEYRVSTTELYYWQFPATYRVSVWKYNEWNSSPSPEDLNISGPGTVVASNSFRAGNWVLYTKDFSISTKPTSDISFKVTNNGINSRSIYIDDFRVSPYEAAVTAYTYDYAGNVTSILNNDNFGVKYEYDAAGRLISTYVEKPTGFEKVSSNKYNYGNQ